jgi:hypothetical protein
MVTRKEGRTPEVVREVREKGRAGKCGWGTENHVMDRKS